MSICPKCHRTVVTGQLGDGTTILLDPVPGTYVAVEPMMDFPIDGARVFRSGALVTHVSVCPVESQEHTARRKAAQQATKGGTL